MTVKKTERVPISLEQELAQRNAELAVISSIQAALAAKLDMQAIYDLIGDKIREIFHNTAMQIRVYDSQTGLMHYPYCYENGERLSLESSPLGNTGFEPYIIRTRETVVINENMSREMEKYGSYLIPGEHLEKSSVFVPLIVADQARGLINLKDMQREHAFSDSDVRLLQTLASAMSTALENARLVDESQRRAQEISTLAEIGREISASLDLPIVLERIASQAMDLLHARDVVLRLLEPDGRLPVVVAIGKYAHIYKDWDVHLGRGLSGTVAQTGIPEILNDPENDPRVIDVPGTEEDRATRASLFAPLLIGETILGVLSVWRDKVEAGPFTQADLDFGLGLARQAAIAIQNARLYAETQQRFKETEILRAANVELTKSLDLDTILAVLLDYLQQLVPYDTGSVFLLEGEDRLTARAARGYEKWVENPQRAIGVSFEFENIPHIRTVIKDQTIVVIPDVTQHPGWVVAETAGHVRNWLAVPLVAAGKTIGMYSLDKVEPGYFTPEHQRLAENLAAQAAIAFQNATLFRNQQVAHEQAETLRAAASALGSTLSLDEVFELILSELRKVVPYDSCSVQQLDGDEMVIVGGHGFPNLDELLGKRFDWRAPDDPAGEVVRKRAPLILADVSARFKHFKDETHGRGRVHGWMGVPLLFGDRLIGMLTLDKLEQNFYTAGHAHLAQAFAIQAATAIENARLYETEQLARERAETQGRQVSALNRVAQAVTSTVDLQTILEIAAREMVLLINARSAGVGLLNHDRSELQVVAYYSTSDEPSAVGLKISMEGNIATQQVIETGQPILITDAQNTPLQNEAARVVMRARNTQCILILPLLARGEVIGTIAPDIDQPDQVFTPEDIQLAQTITNQLAGVIENARLFDETQHLLEETRKAKETAETLRSASLAFTESLNLDSILEKLLDYLALKIPYDSATIFLMEDDKELVAQAVRGYERFVDSSLAQAVRIERGSVPRIDRIIDEQTSIIISDTLQDSSWSRVPSALHIRSWMGIPLVASGRTIGIYSLDKTEPAFFTAEHRHLAEALAAQAAIVIEKSQLFDSEVISRARAETQSRQLNSLNLVAQAVSSTRNLNQILEIAAREIVSQLSARSCGVTLINPERTFLNVIAFAGQAGEPSTVGFSFPIEGNPGTQQAIETRQSVVIADAQNSPLQNEAARENFRLRGTTCIMITPLVVRDEVIGTFGADLTDPDRVYTAEEVRLAETIASQISGAIENARLFDETQRLLKITEQRAAELGVISKVSQALVAETELGRTIQLIGDQMREIFNADIVYLALLDPHTNQIHFPYQVGETFETLALGEGLASKVIQTGQPLLINQDVDERTREIGAVPVGKEALSYLGVPIKTVNGTIGMISVQSTTQGGLFNEDSLRLLTTIAANAGAALHNAQLFSEALENLRQVEILMKAASAIEQSVYEPAMVASVAARTDALGELARVFRNMADEVRLREQRLKRQLQQLQLDIEEQKLAKAETVAVYLPMDRRQALANHRSLPGQVQGAALFADISGFTALTEALANEMGLQRGAEEVIRQLNRVYSVLIDEVHRYGGSVVNFSGDAITCWFDDLDPQGIQRADPSPERAAACALAMQKGMAQFAAITRPDGKTISLNIKVALAAGRARRILVGAGTPHQIDVLAGSTLAALSNAEHFANKGEIVLSASGLSSVEDRFSLSEWRADQQYAVLTGLKADVAPAPWPALAPGALPEAETQAWMLPVVFEKVRAGQSDMLSELRQVAALFLKFAGLDYDADPEADSRLDTFIQWVERVIAPHNGSIIQLTVGDKGSYLYVVFGAPIAHPDDAAQAVLAALELADLPGSLAFITNIQIGLAYGQMRVGAYGGSNHRTYGAIGDMTNLAARLMLAASPAPGQSAAILCNDTIHAAAGSQVEFEVLAPIMVKGKTQPVPVFRPLRKLVELAAGSGIAAERAQLIDRLAPPEQLTLKVASVIGQFFTFQSLSAIYPEEHSPESLQARLQTLAGLDLVVKPSAESPYYQFKDAQTHAAAYNLMLFAQRRQLHRAMAELLEQTVFSVPPYAEIAHHWQAADEIPKAVQYLEKAGEHARQMGDFEEATRFFNASLALNA